MTENNAINGAANSPLELLVMRLAENRATMRATENEIHKLLVGDEGYNNIDLLRYREHWYSFDDAWKGWVRALTHFEDVEGEEATQDEKKLAELLDKKAMLRQEHGHIRRSLCAAGRKLLRAV